jgi:hypothetical protein
VVVVVGPAVVEAQRAAEAVHYAQLGS